MKKILVVLALVLGISVTAQVMQEKTYAVSLTLEKWQKVLQAVDDTKDHQLFKEVNALLVPQLQKQLETEQKAADSLKKKK